MFDFDGLDEAESGNIENEQKGGEHKSRAGPCSGPEMVQLKN